MGDYYRRDKYDNDDDRYERRYPRDEYDRGRSDRYQPLPGSRSRERYPDRERDDYRRDTDWRESADDRNRGDRDIHYDSRDRDYRSPPPHDRDYFSQSRSPPRRPRELEEPSQLPAGPRSQRTKPEETFDAGKPNSQIIFRGIDKDMTEADVSDFLYNRIITNISVTPIPHAPRRCH